MSEELHARPHALRHFRREALAVVVLEQELLAGLGAGQANEREGRDHTAFGGGVGAALWLRCVVLAVPLVSVLAGALWRQSWNPRARSVVGGVVSAALSRSSSGEAAALRWPFCLAAEASAEARSRRRPARRVREQSKAPMRGAELPMAVASAAALCSAELRPS